MKEMENKGDSEYVSPAELLRQSREGNFDDFDDVRTYNLPPDDTPDIEPEVSQRDSFGDIPNKDDLRKSSAKHKVKKDRNKSGRALKQGAEFKRIELIVPKDIHLKVRMLALNKGVSLSQFFIEYVESL